MAQPEQCNSAIARQLVVYVVPAVALAEFHTHRTAYRSRTIPRETLHQEEQRN